MLLKRLERHPDVQWPEEIEKIETCKPNGVTFPDIGKFDACKCIGKCF
ncbi:hypothetical protein PC116_g23152 [Phytophthora cactorum]|nr:hypothetical protein PC116_g23152 [Phytophthora cactorum]